MLASASLLVSLFAASLCAELADSEWPSWRGPGGNGLAEAGDYVTEWAAEPAKNLAWAAELPGRGASTPVLFEAADGATRIALTAEIDGRNGVVCYDLAGERLWATPSGPLEAGKHKKASGANPSIAVGDGGLFAYFKSGELVALSESGDILWTANLAERFGGYDKEALWWDLGTSPITTDQGPSGQVVVAVMQSGPSFLAAFDQQTGELAWKTDRETDAPIEAAQSYTTPALGIWNGRAAIFTAGADTITCHAADGGEELWRIGGLNPEQDGYFRSIASPVVVGGDDRATLLVPYSRGATLRGVALGDDIPTEATWTRDDLGSDVPTPTGAGGVAYIIADKGRDAGLLTAIDAADGSTLGTVRLPKARAGYSSSPTLAGDRLYLLREDGAGFVVDVSDPASMRVAGESSLLARGATDTVVATPVLAEGLLLIRTATMLYAFGEQ